MTPELAPVAAALPALSTVPATVSSSLAPVLHFTLPDWIALFQHFLELSLMAVGGAIALTPEMHRFLVLQQHWLTDTQYSASIAIAQAAPGPNVLFVALMGWNVGLNAGGMPAGLLGMALSMGGILIPSTTLTYLTARWGQRNRNLRAVRAFKQGMGPIVVGLLVATGWVLASAHGDYTVDWKLWLTAAVTAVLIWRTKLHLMLLLGAGAALGWFDII
jgi:chromate transporter